MAHVLAGELLSWGPRERLAPGLPASAHPCRLVELAGHTGRQLEAQICIKWLKLNLPPLRENAPLCVSRAVACALSTHREK